MLFFGVDAFALPEDYRGCQILGNRAALLDRLHAQRQASAVFQ
jgi:hypothetical protein